MKKILTIFVILFFMISMVPAIATEDPDGGELDSSDSVQGNTAEVKTTKSFEGRPIAQKIKERVEIREEIMENRREYLEKRLELKTAKWKLNRLDDLVDNQPMLEEKLRNISQDKIEKFMKLPRAAQKQVLQKNIVTELAKYKIKKVDKEDKYRKRVVSEKKIKNARGKYARAQNEFTKWKNSHQEKKDRFLDAKKRVQECEGVETDECEEIRVEILNNAKEYLENSINMGIEHLNKVKSKVEENDDLEEEEANEIIEKIDELIEKLVDAREKLESIETKEEFQDLVKELEELWQKVKVRANLYSTQLIHSRVGEIIQRGNHLENRIDCIIASIDEQGLEIPNIDMKLEKYSEKIESARIKYNEAKELFEEAKNLRTDKEIRKAHEELRKAQEKLKEGHEELKQAHRKITEILKDIKEAGGNITSCKDDDDYIIVEPDECESNSDCETDETCIDGECEDEEDEEECIEDSDCENGETCIDSECEDAECTEDSDCEGDEICTGGECEDAPECTLNTDCEDEEICVNNECEENETECTTDDDCEEGYVCTDDNECEEPDCIEDADCESDETCQDGECEDVVACTADAFVCPDGTAVGRIAPDCEFEECPLVEQCADYTRDNETIEYCATCGDGECEEYETCTASSCTGTGNNSICTMDCGGLVCEADCN